MAYSITDLCKGCSVCAKLCPVAAVSGIPNEKYTINPRRCVECGVCGRACPKGAVTDAAGNPLPRVPRMDWPKPQFASGKCTACGICVQACTAGALEIAQPQGRGNLHVSAYLAGEKKCVGCGLCAKECPMEAIEMQEASVSPGATTSKKQEEVAA